MKAFALAFLLFAAAPIVIDTTKLAEGAHELRREGSRTVAVTRSGKTVTVHVQEGKRSDTITITRMPGGKLTFSHRDNGQPRQLFGLDRRPVIVDGIDLEPFLNGTAPETGQKEEVEEFKVPPPDRRYNQRGPRYYTCPKDETMVRVPAGRAPAELKCPLDGTLMKTGAGPDSQFYLLQ